MGNVKKEMRIAESKRCVLLKELKEKKAGKGKDDRNHRIKKKKKGKIKFAKFI